ncbi:MAG: DUF935 family protein [Zoogloea sp.]|uniref:DUF935 domain-containing protein n=1 Tax=Zoogloea sp. TaxID=49181 RepID=UPI00261D8CDC|nr:DUF935 family protein [Zoogloea sp.]MDD3328867.1 DUF935 family protein [Zoogloea sp.]
MALLDQYGNPFRLADVAEPQTARVTTLQHWSVQSVIDGLTPSAAAEALRRADGGDIVAQHELFEDMFERDAHLRAEYDKRKGAPLGIDWHIEPPTDASRAEKKAAAAIEDILRNAVDDLEDVILGMMDGVGHGFAPIELEWQRLGAEWLPAFHLRPQAWFQLDRSRRELRLRDGSGEGAVPQPMGWIMHQHVKAKTGYLGRAGLARTLIWPFIYKAYAVGDMAEFLETFGLPFITGKYMQGASDEEKASLLHAVTSLGHDARAIMPEGMLLEISKITGSGDGTPHLRMVEWADAAQSKCLLGQVLSAEAKATGMGSGVAELHALVRRDILKADCRQLAGTLTRDLVYPLAVLNGYPIESLRRCPRWAWEIGETADLKLLSEALPVLAAGGARIPLEWVHEKSGIPMAGDDEPVFGAPAAPPVTPPANPPAALAALTATVPPATPPAAGAATLAQDAAPAWGAILDQVRAIVASADSLPALQAAIGEAFAGLPIDDLTRVMEIAFAAAQLAGRADVAEGA